MNWRTRAITVGITLAMLAAPIAAADAARVRPAGCDPSATRAALWHHANAVQVLGPTQIQACLTYSFKDFGEANLVVINGGAVVHGGPYGPSSNNNTAVFAVARTVDGGGHWTYIPMPTSTAHVGDPRISHDSRTNRVVAVQSSPCTTDLSYSDDNGATWTSKATPGGGLCPAWDFSNTFQGPPKTSEMPTPYPDVLYFCSSAHTVPDRQCWKSLDSGTTWTEFGGSPRADQGGTLGPKPSGPTGPSTARLAAH